MNKNRNNRNLRNRKRGQSDESFIQKYKKCRKIADYIANKLFKMKEKKDKFQSKV